jgi:signal transduction histidine kinase
MQRQAPTHITSLVNAALEQRKLSGLSEMLEKITEAVNAYGCILWQVASGSKLKGGTPSGALFALSQWFRDGRTCDLYNLPIDRSVSGEAVLSQEAINVENIWKDSSGVFRDHPFLRQAGVKSMCSVPIGFLDDADGALNLYRNTPVPFAEEEIQQIKTLASLVPSLYQSIRDKVSLALITRVNEILHDAEVRAPYAPLSKREIGRVIQTICDGVADSFQCLETSIFLEDPLERPGLCELIASTWPGLFNKVTYEKKVEDGLTGWVLARAKPVRIFHMANFERDKKSIGQKYSGITWLDSLDIKLTGRKYLGLNTNAELPILSFMAAPIAEGERVHGAIRCAVSRKGPYYFADRDLDLLTLVAAQISQYWSSWLRRRETQEENKTWQALIDSVGKLNNFVYKELNREVPDERRIFDEALRRIGLVTRGADIMDIRLLDDTQRELYFAQTHGKAWDEGTEKEVQDRKQRRFPVDDNPPTSAGAYVFKTGQAYVIPDVRSDRHYYSETFLGTKRMMIAPIKVEQEIFGVLDIRGTGEFNFPPHAEAIAELLGGQLGLYHFLSKIIIKLRKAQPDNILREQVHTFEDLAHQLKTSIFPAYARTQKATSVVHEWLDKDIKPDSYALEKLEADLQAMRRLCWKARGVAISTKLFADLERGESVRLHLKSLRCDDLAQMLTDAARDTESMINPKRNIKFSVEPNGFKALYSNKVYADYELLEQAVNNLLENAGKYSFRSTEVRIYAGLTHAQQFHMTFANTGFSIQQSEVSWCIQRGWQGDEAKSTRGEGTGIGLWIVDNIMKAHGAKLVIVPTSADGVTEIKLVFPCAGVRP